MKTAALVYLLLCFACSCTKHTEQDTGGFLGVPWGTAVETAQEQWVLQPLSEMGEVTVFNAGIFTFKGIQIENVAAAFRNNKFIGVAFEIPNTSPIGDLIDTLNTTYGGKDEKPTSLTSTGTPTGPDSTGVQSFYRWETPLSTVVVMREHGSTTYVFIMKKGESLPQMS